MTDYANTDENQTDTSADMPLEKFSFDGTPLDEYARRHRAAVARLTFDGMMTDQEYATYIIYLLMASRRSKDWHHEIDAIRGEGCAKFRIAAMNWAETAIKTDAKAKEALAVVDKILELARRADDVEVEPSKGAPGKA